VVLKAGTVARPLAVVVDGVAHTAPSVHSVGKFYLVDILAILERDEMGITDFGNFAVRLSGAANTGRLPVKMALEIEVHRSEQSGHSRRGIPLPGAVVVVIRAAQLGQ